MPIYIVRWPGRSASIIHAADEEHLMHLLDYVGDLATAIWEEYDGPLWIELHPKWAENEAGELKIGRHERFGAETHPWDVMPTSASLATYWTILARLFPHIYLALRQLHEGESAARAKARIVEALERERWLAIADENRQRPQLDPSQLERYAAMIAGELPTDDELTAQVAAIQRETIEWRRIQYARLRVERRQALEDLAEFSGQAVSSDDGDGGGILN